MREMVWDEELAIKAQQWANECTFEHDPSRYLGERILRKTKKIFVIWHRQYPIRSMNDEFIENELFQ